MDKKMGLIKPFLFFLGLLLLLDHESFAASLPKSTQQMLKKLKLNPSILADVDQELTVPDKWVKRAREEGKLRVTATWRPAEVKAIFAPFHERYPFINVDYSGGTRTQKLKVLLAYKMSGRIMTDVIFGIGGNFARWKEANALEDMRNLPGFNNIPGKARDPNGLRIGISRNHWCMSYNTRLVKKEELPKRWEDLLTSPIWRGGNLALGNRPESWVIYLWQGKGENWAKDFVTKLFTKVKPQLRKEGLGALVQLVAAGEFHAVIPSLPTIVSRQLKVGAPVGFACPEPVPASIGDAISLKGSPSTYAARLFLNWFLSKEGQIANYFARNVTPVHKDLQRPELTTFADQVLGKELIFNDPDLEVKIAPKLFEFWNNLWLMGGGTKR